MTKVCILRYWRAKTTGDPEASCFGKGNHDHLASFAKD